MTDELSQEERSERLAVLQLAVEQHRAGVPITARCPVCEGQLIVRDVGGPPGAAANVYDVECPGGELNTRFWGI